MRVDQVLHWLCLVKSRSQATRACREGRVLVAGERVRPSREIRAGDEITLRGLISDRIRLIRIEEVPVRQQSRKEAGEFYAVLSDQQARRDTNGDLDRVGRDADEGLDRD